MDVIYAYGQKKDGTGYVLTIGVTDDTLTRVLKSDKGTVLVNPEVAFGPITQVLIFHEPTKDALRAKFHEVAAQLGVPLTVVH